MKKYLGIDLGNKTIGLARSDGSIAFAWKTLHIQEMDWIDAFQQLENVIKEYQPQVIVLGFPLNMDGSHSTQTKITQNFYNGLSSLVSSSNIALVLQDERRTTQSALSILSSSSLSKKKQKLYKDELSAALILQTYLDKITKFSQN